MNVYDLFADLAAEASRPELAWMDDAACSQVGGDAWFPEKSEAPTLAKRICMSCPVRASCADYAIENIIPWGVWGGLTPRERMARRNGRRQVA